MITEINRMIVWLKTYGLDNTAILQMLSNMAGEDAPLPQTEASAELESRLRDVAPDPCERAKLLYSLVQIEPENEIDPEDAVERMQMLPILLTSIRDIVENAISQEQAAEKINALLSRT